MRADLKKRLEALEDRSMDHIAKLDLIDYLPLVDYSNDPNWVEIFFDQTVTVYRNKITKEIRGSYRDRRTDEELLSKNGKLEYR